MKRKLKLQ